ncbi:hypothetical protein [Neolewinella antarctica]|uniref:Uncharacterized protein n=1 Tax=Neolewinella antarctica TaxID=442734 RepID=A0ABX0XGV8_9BACT|nr:hypothetical protein [Neolewinella antarctica]NJC28144.1 hypothetical protein [Neolewinella antarctica]
MMKFLSSSKLLMFLLALTAVSFTSCEDDDDVLGMDFNDDGTLFISSNTQMKVGILDTRDSDNRELFTFDAAGADSDGIYFDERGDGLLYQVNRSANTVVQYEDVLDDFNDDEGVNISLTSAAGGFSNGRGLTPINNSQFLVADDQDDDDGDQLVLYSNTNGDAINRVATYNVAFNLWGIRFHDNTLYAVVDNTDSVAVFTNTDTGLFATADGGDVVPNRFIKVDGIVRTHGLTFIPQSDLMILTDVGSGASDSDGAIIVIRNFSTITGDSISSANYTRIAGASTRLGNPVDVAYDEENEEIYVAERLNSGGLLLSFPLDAVGNVAPKTADTFTGISSLYLNND